MSKNLAIVFDLISRSDTAGFIKVSAAADRTTAAVARTETAVGRMNGVFGVTAKTAAKFGVALGGFEIAKKVIDSGREFTTALNSVQAVARATGPQMAAVRKEALGLGRDLSVPGATAIDAADAINELVKAGIKLPRALDAARPALLLASATQTNMADTARVLGDTMDIFSIKGKGASHAASILSASALGASHDLVGLFDALKQAGPAAQALHVGLDDTSTALVYLAKHGLSTEAGGNGLKTFFATLSKDTPKGIAALKDLGVTAFTSQGKFEGFPKVFDQLHAAQARFGTDGHRFLHDLNAAFGTRAQNVASLFAKGTGKDFDELKKHLESMNLQQTANLMNRGLTASLRQLGKEATAVGLDIYDKTAPAFVSIIEAIGHALPAAIAIGKSALAPFGSAWTALSDVLKPIGGFLLDVGHALKPIAPALKELASGAVTAYLAFKGFALAKAAFTTIGIYTKGAILNTADWATETLAANRAVIASNEAVAGSTAEVAAATGARAGAAGGAASSGLLASGAARAAGAYALLAVAIGEVAKQSYKMPTKPPGFLGTITGSVDSARGFDNASKLGKYLNTELTTGYAKQHKAQVKAADDLNTLSEKYKTLAVGQDTVSAAAQKYAGILGITFDKAGKASVGAQAVQAAIQLVSQAENNATASGSEFLAQLDTFAHSAGNAADRAALIGSILKANAGDTLGFQSAINGAAVAVKQFGTDAAANAKTAKLSLDGYGASLINIKNNSIDYTRAGAAPLLADLGSIQTAAINAAQAQYQHSKSLVGGKAAADQAVASYTGVENSLQGQLTKLGLTSAQAHKLTQAYLGTPSRVRTTIEAAGANPVLNVLNKIGRLLAHITGQRWDATITLDANITANANRAVSILNKFGGSGHGATLQGPHGLAVGGVVRGPGTGTSDTAGVYALSNGEAVIPARAVSMNRGLISSLIAQGRGRASGIEHVGKEWLFGGQRYASERAAQNAEARAAKSATTAQSRAAKTLATLKLKIDGTDLARITKALKGTVDQIQSAFATLFADAKKAGLSSSTLTRLSAEAKAQIAVLANVNKVTAGLQAKLGTKSTAGTTAYDRLATAMQNFNDKESSIASAITSIFDPTQAGIVPAATDASDNPTLAALRARARISGGGPQQFGDESLINQQLPATSDLTVSLGQFIGNLTGDASTAKKFRADLAKLKAKGINKALYDQLASAGPSSLSTVDALLGGSASQIANINKQYGSLVNTAAATGKDVAKVIDGAEVVKDQAVVDQLKAQLAAQRADAKALKQSVDALAGQIAKALNNTAKLASMHGRTTPAGKKT